MLTVIRFLALSASVAGFHIFDGLGFAALAFGFLIGLLAVRFYWLALPAAGLANLSNLMYAESTGPGKFEGALGVFPVEFFVFIVLTGFGCGVGVWVRHVLAWRLERRSRLGAAQPEAQAAPAEQDIVPAEAQVLAPEHQPPAPTEGDARR